MCNSAAVQCITSSGPQSPRLPRPLKLPCSRPAAVWCACPGLGLYQAFLVHSPLKSMLMWCSAAGVVLNATQLLLVSRVNKVRCWVQVWSGVQGRRRGSGSLIRSNQVVGGHGAVL